jgi:hypothetical protein
MGGALDTLTLKLPRLLVLTDMNQEGSRCSGVCLVTRDEIYAECQYTTQQVGSHIWTAVADGESERAGFRETAGSILNAGIRG